MRWFTGWSRPLDVEDFVLPPFIQSITGEQQQQRKRKRKSQLTTSKQDKRPFQWESSL